MKRERLDEALVRLQIADTVEKARAIIMEGRVFQNGQRLDKPALPLKTDAGLVVKGDKIPYVSRGGLKLERAIRAFALDLSGLTCLDVGSSTGGFTDCMLQNGAQRVFSVDVGYGLLDWKLRNDPRVTVMERTNARYLTADDLPLKPTLGVMDVSFISITKILPAAAAIMGEDGEFISLIKPQFEAGRDRVGKKGVVRDAQVHLDVVKEILQFIDADMGWTAQNLSFSPIKGPEGNIEFLVHILPKCRATHCVTEQEAAEVVRQAHESLGNA